ncbi:MAG TPA: prenyltransferase/squalene oxidase repeat-containing protein [Pirellulales bacterium]|jgi:squalene-hopene/tetraprenyl-beta-curcumene cyclase|nr:prenyltransferase/squalene oxidase repeat-containing protein [Pirellulales bacterium]
MSRYASTFRSPFSQLSLLAAVTLIASAIVADIPLRAADATSSAAGPSAKEREDAVSRGIEYLRSRGQTEEGAFTKEAGPALTALVTTSLLRSGRTPDDPMVARSLRYLEGFVQADGGIYQPESNYKNYETCLAIVTFGNANHNGRYRDLLAKAEAFVKGLQWDESEDVKPSDVNYGGAGYGKSKRPDLSNTSFLFDALHAAGAGADDEAIKKALVFVSRCQNLETEYNTTEFSAKNPDGGFYYTPAGGGSSPSGKTDNGGLRSYASMTYAGLKSMIYAGLTADDPRVKAALEWLKKNYTLDSNPGMGDGGLYYYYDAMAKALDARGDAVFVDEAGNKHDWRSELAAALIKRQRPDGSWLNENARWMEGDPNLVTAYALLALSYCQPKPSVGDGDRPTVPAQPLK